MKDDLHIHIPCGDDGIAAIEKALGVKFQRWDPPHIASEKVEVCPMSSSSRIPEYMSLMSKINWYAHGAYSTMSENLEEVKRIAGHLPDDVQQKLAEQIADIFYEVKFNLTINEDTGKITEITLAKIKL